MKPPQFLRHWGGFTLNAYKLVNIFAVGGDDLRIPCIRILEDALSRALPTVINIDINKAVALAHLA